MPGAAAAPAAGPAADRRPCGARALERRAAHPRPTPRACGSLRGPMALPTPRACGSLRGLMALPGRAPAAAGTAAALLHACRAPLSPPVRSLLGRGGSGIEFHSQIADPSGCVDLPLLWSERPAHPQDCPRTPTSVARSRAALRGGHGLRRLPRCHPRDPRGRARALPRDTRAGRAGHFHRSSPVETRSASAPGGARARPHGCAWICSGVAGAARVRSAA
jgi:hypothetical protein